MTEEAAGQSRVTRQTAERRFSGWTLLTLGVAALLAWRLPDRIRESRSAAARKPSPSESARASADSLLSSLRQMDPESFAAGQRRDDLLETLSSVPSSRAGDRAHDLLRAAEAARRKLLDRVLPAGAQNEKDRVQKAAETLRGLREAVAAASSAPSDRPAALRIEYMDALVALATGKPALAASGLEQLVAEADLPPDMDPTEIAERLGASREATATGAEGAEAAAEAAELFSARLAEAKSPDESWMAASGRWCALGAARAFAGEADASAQVTNLRRLAADFSSLPALGPTADEMFIDLSAWAAARWIDAQLAGDTSGALELADALSALLRASGDREVPALTRRSARLLEERGRERLLAGDASGVGDLRAAASKRLSLESLAGGDEAVQVRGEAAELLELAGDLAGVAALLSPLVPRRPEDDLRLARAWTGLREHEKAVSLLDALLASKGSLDAASWDGSPEANAKLGPIFEEARLFRAAACLEIAARLDPGAVEARRREDAAARDLDFLLENLAPSSEICSAALYLRGLDLERHALESWASRLEGSDAGWLRSQLTAAAECLERLVQAGSLPDTWRAAALDRLATLDERLGRLDRAREHLGELASISVDALRKPGPPRLRALLRLSPGILRELVAGARYRLADAALLAGDRKLALEDYRRALSIDGDSIFAPWAHVQAAEILRDAGDGVASAKERELALASLEGLQGRRSAAAGTARVGLRVVLETWRDALLERLQRP